MSISIRCVCTTFGPTRLQATIAQLGEQLQPIAHDARLKDAQQTMLEPHEKDS